MGRKGRGPPVTLTVSSLSLLYSLLPLSVQGALPFLPFHFFYLLSLSPIVPGNRVAEGRSSVSFITFFLTPARSS